MTILNTIRATLDNHLSTTPSIPPIAPQNVHYTPTPGVTFLKPTLVPTLIRPATRGLNPQLRYDGLYSILICTPEGDGPGAAYELADILLQRFPSATDISFGGIIVSINYTEVGTSYFDAPFYCTPLNVAWYIYHN